MKSQEIPPEKKIWFIGLSAVTITIVLAGWFFSFRDSWRAANLSFSFSKITEVKQGVSEIASDFKEEIQGDTMVLDPVLDQAIEVLREKENQEAVTKKVIGELIKDQLVEENSEAVSTDQVSTINSTTEPEPADNTVDQIVQ